MKNKLTKIVNILLGRGMHANELLTIEEKVAYIRAYEFHPVIIERFTKETNKKFNICLTEQDVQNTIDGLKDFFIASKVVGYAQMPSRIIDELWHLFMIYTKTYMSFCAPLGGYIHHAPDDLSESNPCPKAIEAFNKKRQTDFFRTYETCCELEGLNPLTTKQLPRLFAMDSAHKFENQIVFCNDKFNADYKNWLNAA